MRDFWILYFIGAIIGLVIFFALLELTITSSLKQYEIWKRKTFKDDCKSSENADEAKQDEMSDNEKPKAEKSILLAAGTCAVCILIVVICIVFAVLKY